MAGSTMSDPTEHGVESRVEADDDGTFTCVVIFADGDAFGINFPTYNEASAFGRGAVWMANAMARALAELAAETEID